MQYYKRKNTPYKSVTIWKENDPNRSVTMHLHRLKALAFCENKTGLPFEQTQVNHIDGNKLNNNVNNLEIVIQADNIRHAYKTGLQRHETPIVVEKPNGERIEFRSQRKACEYLDRNPASLNEILKSNNPNRRCAGCKVWYKNDNNRTA